MNHAKTTGKQGFLWKNKPAGITLAPIDPGKSYQKPQYADQMM
jgi:hypothetical protein